MNDYSGSSSSDRDSGFELQLPASLLASLTRTPSHPTSFASDEDGSGTLLESAPIVTFLRDDAMIDDIDRLSEISSTGLSDLSTVFSTEDEWHSIASSRCYDPRRHILGMAHHSTHGHQSTAKHVDASDTSSYAAANSRTGSTTCLSSVAQRYAKMRNATQTCSHMTMNDSVDELLYPSANSSVLSFNLKTAPYINSQARHGNLKGSLGESNLTPASLGSSWDDAGSPLQPGRSGSIRPVSTRSMEKVLHKPSLVVDVADQPGLDEPTHLAKDLLKDKAGLPIYTSTQATNESAGYTKATIVENAPSDSSIYPPSTLSFSAPPTISSSLAASIAITEHTFEQRAGSHYYNGNKSAISSRTDSDNLSIIRSYRHESELEDSNTSAKSDEKMPAIPCAASAVWRGSKRLIISTMAVCALAALVAYLQEPTIVVHVGLPKTVMVPILEQPTYASSSYGELDVLETVVTPREPPTVIIDDAVVENVGADPLDHQTQFRHIVSDSAAVQQAELFGFLMCLASGSIVWLFVRLLRWAVGSSKFPSLHRGIPGALNHVEDDKIGNNADVQSNFTPPPLNAQRYPLACTSATRLATPACAKKQVSFAKGMPQNNDDVVAPPKFRPAAVITASVNAPLSALRFSPTVVTRAMARSAALQPINYNDGGPVETSLPEPARSYTSGSHAAALAALARGLRAVSAPMPVMKTEVRRSQCASPSSSPCAGPVVYEKPYLSRLRPRPASVSACTRASKRTSQPRPEALHHVFVASFNAAVDMHASKLLARITGKSYPATIEEAASYKCRSHSQLFDRDGKIIELLYRFAEAAGIPDTFADWDKHNARFVKLNEVRARDVYIYLYNSCDPATLQAARQAAVNAHLQSRSSDCPYMRPFFIFADDRATAGVEVPDAQLQDLNELHCILDGACVTATINSETGENVDKLISNIARFLRNKMLVSNADNDMDVDP